MEQEDSDRPAYTRPHLEGGEGSFDRPLPLDGEGPFDSVTCRIKNTLRQPGAVLDLQGCRLELPMRYLGGGRYYRVSNGRGVEQYDTDSGLRMVVVLADVPGGGVLPVRVYPGGRDRTGPRIDEARIGDGSGVTGSLEVELTLQAHDGEAGLMDLRVSNRADFAGARWIPARDGRKVVLPWRLAPGRGGVCRVYVQFRDAAMPGNVSTQTVRVLYRPRVRPEGR